MRAYAACWKPFVVPEAAPLPPWGRIRRRPSGAAKPAAALLRGPARRLCAPWPATPTGGGPCGGACGLPAAAHNRTNRHHRYLLPQRGYGRGPAGTLPLPLLGEPARRPQRHRPSRGQAFCALAVHRFPAPQLSLDQCLALRDRFRQNGADGCSFHYLEELLRPRDLAVAIWRYMRICFSSLRLERAARPAFRLPGSQLNFWEYLGPYWAESFRGWRGLERCLQLRACECYAAAAGPQRWTLFPLENCPWERMLTAATHRAGQRPGGGGPAFHHPAHRLPLF